MYVYVCVSVDKEIYACMEDVRGSITFNKLYNLMLR